MIRNVYALRTAAAVITLGLTASGIQAADSELGIKGRIMPAACTLAIDGKGEYAYGDIDRADVCCLEFF